MNSEAGAIAGSIRAQAPTAFSARAGGSEQVASVAAAKRALLLRAYRGRLRDHDLEDCYSQATLELLLRVERRGPFGSAAHIANALEQKLCSRIHDRRRALAGRSPLTAAIEGSLRLDVDAGSAPELPDPRASVDEQVYRRLLLRDLLDCAERLSADQRLALSASLNDSITPRQFAERQGWSIEKHRKLIQRGRRRLRQLLDPGENLPAVVPGARPAVKQPPVLAERAPAGAQRAPLRALDGHDAWPGGGAARAGAVSERREIAGPLPACPSELEAWICR